MRQYDAAFLDALTAARDEGIAPVYFLWIEARDGETISPVGFWSRSEDVTVTVETPDGSSEARTYTGGVGMSVEGFQEVTDLTDRPVTVSLSQIADSVQAVVRGLNVRLARCEIHVGLLNGAALVSNPQLEFVGVVDEVGIPTPSAGSDASMSLTLRDEIITQMTALNPAKSSDEHQKRRASGDRFCEYASTVSSRDIKWGKKD